MARGYNIDTENTLHSTLFWDIVVFFTKVCVCVKKTTYIHYIYIFKKCVCVFIQIFIHVIIHDANVYMGNMGSSWINHEFPINLQNVQVFFYTNFYFSPISVIYLLMMNCLLQQSYYIVSKSMQHYTYCELYKCLMNVFFSCLEETQQRTSVLLRELEVVCKWSVCSYFCVPPVMFLFFSVPNNYVCICVMPAHF